jgi:copper homeostasis protein
MIVEIVCCSVDDCVEAANGGADRIELCGAIEAGGLTPTIGLYEEAASQVSLPLICMIRPRGAGFDYSSAEFATMERDMDSLLEAGAPGFVTGVLQADGSLDLKRNRALVERAGKATKVCHRCFDVTPDPLDALEQLIDLGFDRILTSGQRAFADEGLALIRTLVKKADGRIEILPAGGLRMGNVVDFVRQTGVEAVHLAPFQFLPDRSTQHNPEIKFAPVAPDEGVFNLIDGSAVRAVVSALSATG